MSCILSFKNVIMTIEVYSIQIKKYTINASLVVFSKN